MFNITETSNFDTNVSGNDTTDAVLGGASGPANAGLTNLTNRSRWLHDQLVALQASAAPINAPNFTGNARAPNVTAGDSSTKIANTSFVANAFGGIATVGIGGGTNTLTAAQYGCKIIILTGTPGTPANVVFPNSGDWQVINRATGSFASAALKTAGGTGYTLAGGRSASVTADGTNLAPSLTDVASTGSGAQPSSVGTYTAQQSDQNSTFVFSGGVTVTLDPNKLTAGWMATFCLPQNVGGTLALTPNHSATLDGVASRAGTGGTCVEIYFDGSNFTTVSGSYIFTQSIAAGGWSAASMLNYAHNLGVVSSSARITVTATCQTTQFGYSVGDVASIASFIDSTNSGIGTFVRGANVYLILGTVVVAKPSFIFGTQVSLTPANWSLNLTIETR